MSSSASSARSRPLPPEKTLHTEVSPPQRPCPRCGGGGARRGRNYGEWFRQVSFPPVKRLDRLSRARRLGTRLRTGRRGWLRSLDRPCRDGLVVRARDALGFVAAEVETGASGGGGGCGIGRAGRVEPTGGVEEKGKEFNIVNYKFRHNLTLLIVAVVVVVAAAAAAALWWWQRSGGGGGGLVVVVVVVAAAEWLETLAYGTCAGKIKLVGITLSIGGVMLLAFFKRVEININVSPTKFSLLPQHYNRTRDHYDQVLGLVFSIIAAFSNACFLTIQAKFKEDTQNIYLIPFMMNLMGAIQGVVYALGVERDWEKWQLGWNIRFWASSFVGVFGSGLTTTLITWCISEMGPLFVSTFNPIGLILMALVGALVLQETLYVTSVAAIVLIIAATLLVLYGKIKEMDNTNVNYQSEGSGSEENEDEDVDSSILVITEG
ncbi:hypothetical protein RHGRI_032532 [Rhododendron griersonianum]|uniref:EamA domain-containing protein n=1 Tax=Rhododendron griersonianum TaxID=479676 RepID=A0AAV6ICU6_9ERIC|nr:hypothetical protein RHGRI_032532 [Rhododendron griersonianum]